MNALQMAATAVALITGIGSATAGVVYTLENKGKEIVAYVEERYVPVSEYKDFQWVFYKRELRELEAKIENEENPVLRARLQDDYQAVLDRFCRSYPDDREC